MEFIRVQLLNLLKLTINRLLRNYWEKIKLYKHKDNGKTTLFIHSNFKSNHVSKKAHSIQLMFLEQLEKLIIKFLHFNNLRLRSKDDVLLGVEVTPRIPKESLR